METGRWESLISPVNRNTHSLFSCIFFFQLDWLKQSQTKLRVFLLISRASFAGLTLFLCFCNHSSSVSCSTDWSFVCVSHFFVSFSLTNSSFAPCSPSSPVSPSCTFCSPLQLMTDRVTEVSPQTVVISGQQPTCSYVFVFFHPVSVWLAQQRRERWEGC